MEALNTYIDYTILKPGTTLYQVETLCRTAVERQYAAVCISPSFVADVKEIFSIEENPPAICTVVGFPHGMHTSATKLFECEACVEMGASELDLVANNALAKNGRWDDYSQEIGSFSRWCSERNITSKLIIETSLLTENEMAMICELVKETPLDFVKTSTGFVGEGAQLEHVRFLRQLLPERYRIKASGGIRDVERAKQFIQAGAARIGTSTAL